MDVKSISSQNFGALRIYEAEKALKALPAAAKEKTVAALEKASYELSDTKHCHVDIGSDLIPTIDINAKERYREVFNIIPPDGDHIQFGTIYDGAEYGAKAKGERIIATYKANSKQAALNFYNEVKNEKNPITIAAKLAKFIEDALWNESQSYQTAQSSLDSRIDKLVKNNDYYNL